MPNRNWNEYSTEELADTLSDYHKDVHGFRVHENDRTRILEKLAELDAYMDYLKATPQGRQMLRTQGWYVEEPVHNQ